MNLRWLSLFATIADEGSFTRAATKLNIAQPWLSAQLRKLEHELGVQLLIRENVGIKVTEAGKQLLPHARQIAESARLFRETARSLSESRSRAVKLGSHIPIIDVPVLKTIALDFADRYNNFELSTVMNEPMELVKALDECSIDLAFLPSELTGGSVEMDFCSFGESQVTVLVPAKRKVRKLGDLKGETVGLPPSSWGPELRAKLCTLFADAGIVAGEIPEFDRRAIEHSVDSRGALAVIALNDNDLATLDPAITVLKLEGLFVEQRLCRLAGRELGRAAERFWALCERKTQAGLGDEPIQLGT